MTPRLVLAAALLAVAAPASQAADSLYKEDQFQSLTADRRGSKVGDLVTVLVYETSSATSTADTRSDRDAEVGVDVTGTRRRYGAAASTRNGMEGHGRTERSGRLLAQVTVTIQEVLPNGDLRLAGEQLLEINDERQQIRLEGRVRAVDLQENNMVVSSRLADARITYLGNGVLGDKQRPGWWQRLLTAFGL